MNIGEKAPHFSGIDAEGKEITLEQFAGQKVVLYFYPKDNTSGCTAEACSLRDNSNALAQAGYTIIGVSPDSPKSHQGFAAKHKLPFILIADTDHSIAESFSVWGEKSMYGRKYMGIFRTTFLIDEAGVITDIFGPKSIKTKEHGQQILSRINE